MITDQQTNFVYLSGLLELKCPGVFEQLTYWFGRLNICYSFLICAKDLWVVDFMPLQINRDKYVQFKYDPDYLKPKIHQHTWTDPKDCCTKIKVNTTNSIVVLDGGNVVKHSKKVILTDKIFKENYTLTEDDLLTEIRTKLSVEQLIIIPQEPNDFVGHADGMVRFINEDTVLVNQYPDNKKYQSFSCNLRLALRNAGLKCIPFPYTAWRNKDANDATGCYINFLEIGYFIFLPAFGAVEDELAVSQLRNIFSNREIIIIDCSELAKAGGVLNCATWNILNTK